MRYFLLLGSNLGDREKNIYQAIARLKKKGLREFARSALYESLPWGFRSQPRFLNRALGVDSKLPPGQLLKTVKGVEKEIGRIKIWRWGARRIDIDILLIEGRTFNSRELRIPHPLIKKRAFAVVPLAELRPRTFHPTRPLDRSKVWTAT